ncbi:hypothetical protein [Micromonospora sp. LOL_015]|uniref:hypothetical protein n=1 Tax=Micromonospora sp. LOL_015 TaxID=3345416 RepID=UPI003A844F2D
MIVALFAAFVILTTASLAQAATYFYYANDTPTAELQHRYSGVRPSISGGMASSMLGGDAGSAYNVIETYYSYPGYQTVGYASSGGTVYLSHAQVVDASQKFHWDWPIAGGTIPGELDLTCASRN